MLGTYRRTYRRTEHVTALEDTGAEVAMVNTGLIRHLNLPVLDKIIIRPVVGQTVEADLVPLKIKPYAAKPYTNEHSSLCGSYLCSM